MLYMTKYDHPELILHIPDFYDKKYPVASKWKDRFSTTVKSAAQSLIQYLEWTGDPRRQQYNYFTSTPTPPEPKEAPELGPFAVYRLDERATYVLRKEMEKMDGSKRFKPQEPRKWIRGSEPEFARELRKAIERSLR